jgi:hypothetical protein
VAFILYQGHQKREAAIALGNQKADKEAKQAALTRGPTPTVLMAALFPGPLAEWDPQYIPQEQVWFKTEERNFLLDGWSKFANGHVVLPESLTPTFVKQFHEGTHSGQAALKTTLAQHFYVPSSPA